ncbi:protein FAR1-RELATED SEQUENCE 3-like isoform X2 [Magnolia sinica]|uniref:protein FAR1-RELATED SEQUENCE 3-like isoform X2 n=1 Tax=Magnolia sinica TaxID=86752 RepID=UPI00265B2FB2|nr:protein FAR1-RELATED SEQUENCE 3-like isoform X2 [Magnolia sinica]
MFEFVRILCRHALIVFRLANILVLPSHYIVERYKRNGKSGPVCDENDFTTHDDSRESLMLRFSYLCHQAVRYAEEGSTSVDVYDVAVRTLQRSLEEVLAAKRNAAMDAQFPNPLSGSILDDNLDGGNQTDHSTNQITLLNQCTSSRECPASCRMPHILEKHPNGRRMGTIYGVNGHDDSGCSTLRISSDTEILSARFDMHDPPPALEFWNMRWPENSSHPNIHRLT